MSQYSVRDDSSRRMDGELGGAVEFDGGGVAERVEDAEHVSWKVEKGKWKLGRTGQRKVEIEKETEERRCRSCWGLRRATSSMDF
jgi:hypothetical protein